MIKVFETENSIYEFRDGEYRRTAVVEQEVESHRLIYGEWIKLADISEPYILITNDDGIQFLHIMANDSYYGIYTTPVVDQYESAETL